MNELHIDKTHWKKYRFDEVCRQVNEATKDPQAEGLDHVIGLEHIEPNNLHIAQWDTLEKETTFTRKFRNGQVLFGRRRAYQRKVAYAEFDGICSGDILVFEAIEEVLLPELLPFLIQSEGFFQKALATSAGSLSPRTKFKELADYEFLLPPKAEQKRLAELLWAADEVVEKEKRERERVEELLEIDCANTLGPCNNGQYESLNQSMIKISDVISKERFEVGKLETEQYQSQGRFPIIDQSKSFIAGYSDFGDIVFKGHLPVLVFGDHTTIVKYIDIPFILGADGTKIVKANEEIVTTKFLFYAIKNLHIMPQGYRRHFSILKELQIPSFSISKQNECVTRWDKLEEVLKTIRQQIEISQQIKQELINKVF
ncbi:MAG: restriction endonuclease subunit S [Bacteroidales bacterium]|nr:restriction endonuclease subunit S [Bacteroidales bacterium]